MKGKHIKSIIMSILLIVVIAAFGGCIDMDDLAVDFGLENEIDNMNRKFNVIFRNTPGITVTSESDTGEKNIYRVDRGGFQTLKFIVNEGYEYIPELNEYEAEYDESKGEYVIELRNISSPMTVDVVVGRTDDKYRIEFLSNLDGITLPKKLEMWDWELKKHTGLKVRWDEETYQFVAWSQGSPMGDGGQVVSTDPEFTYDPELYDGKKLVFYANFTSNIHVSVVYSAECGTLDEPMLKKHTEYFLKGVESIFSMKQAMNLTSLEQYFKRDGYVPIGYSTVRIDDIAMFNCGTLNDGDPCEQCPCLEHIPGYVNLGGVTHLPKIGTETELHVVWAKESDPVYFTYSLVTLPSNDPEDGITETVKEEYKITRYNGQDRIVVIPAYIDGIPVVSIEPGAFSGDNLRMLVLSSNVTSVKENAFSMCHNLSEIVYFDTLREVSNESFYYESSGNHNIKTVVVNSAMLPAYSGTTEGSYAVKYERLRTLNSENKKKLIILSGSSSLYGLNSKYLQDLIGNGYNVINYGVDSNDSASFYLDVISNYLQSGDIVVHAPELDKNCALGLNEIRWTMFRGNNQCYDIFKEVDMRMYTNYWDAWKEFKDNSSYKIGSEYQKDTQMNLYGDLTTDHHSKGYTVDDSALLTIDGNIGVWNSIKKGAEILNRIHEEKIIPKGAKMLASFATVDGAYLADGEDKYDAITQKYAEQLHYPVISNIGTFVMDEKYMSSSVWHCTNQGAVVRTRELATDIKEFISQGINSGASTYKSFQARKALNATDYPAWNDKNMH